MAATNFGLGTCWIGRLGYDETIKEVLGIPARIKVIALTPLDYPAETPRPKTRKSLSEMFITRDSSNSINNKRQTEKNFNAHNKVCGKQVRENYGIQGFQGTNAQ